MELLLSVPGWGGTHLERPTKKNCDLSLVNSGLPQGYYSLELPKGYSLQKLKHQNISGLKKEVPADYSYCMELLLSVPGWGGTHLESPTKKKCDLSLVHPGLLNGYSLGLPKGYFLQKLRN
jgi:hypothetical protein